MVTIREPLPAVGRENLLDVYEIAAAVPDPELPQLTLEDLGILREVHEDAGTAVVTITPTYSGCPAIREISADLANTLTQAGYRDVEIRMRLSPPWTSDWITAQGHAKLAAAGIAPPQPAARRDGPIPLTLGRPAAATCPHCGSTNTRQTSTFSSTACKSLHSCIDCAEPFEAVKAL
jgi:ring-1,2-phenylacetyl-CoA epoxidase subunit PaaD